MNIGILTLEQSPYGKNVLAALKKCGLEIKGVFLVKDTFKRKFRLFQKVGKKTGWLNAVVLTVIRIVCGFVQSTPRLNYRELCSSVQLFESVKSSQLEEAIKNAGIDILILAQSGIIGKGLIEAPRIGVINAHPGILPYYRGIDCPLWAIHDNAFDKIGNTLHWVDSGIDTGRIISQRPYAFKGHETIFNLEYFIMIDCVFNIAGFIKNGKPGMPEDYDEQDPGDGKYTFKMPVPILFKTARKLRKFLSSPNNRISSQAG